MTNTSISSAFAGGIAQSQIQKTSGTSSSQKTGDVTVTSSGADAAVISTASSALAHAMKSDDARMEKVASLKSSIENGSYNIAPSAVADKLIDGLLK